MEQKKQFIFGQFRLDEINEVLWHGSRAITLRPKAFAVLQYLLKHPGQLVTKQQLLDAVWSDAYVGDAVLKDIVRQIREALQDDVKSPQFIETAHRRGYRFIGQVREETEQKGADSEARVTPHEPPDSSFPPQTFAPASPVGVLGRETALARLRGWLEKPLLGDRQVVFITGEPGIGKTTLVEAFLDQAAALHPILVARGQCFEQYGAGEPYMPVLDALSRLCREPGRARVIETLRKHAPTWLAQMPWIIAASGGDELQRRAPGTTRERMLREMAEAVEALTAESPLVLVLEDLHWSDYSTLDLISYLARRREPVRLMVIGTYRPVEVILSEHPLKGVKQELQAHRLCKELPLDYLTEAAIGEFLAARFPHNQFPIKLARLIHQRTGGNPLFLVNLVDYLLDERIIVEHQGRWQLQVELAEIELGVPESVRHLIEKQVERLGAEDQRVLEAASVVGMECSAVAIAAALDGDLAQVEERCEELAKRDQFLSPPVLVELPDGAITPRFKFNHVLYLNVLYNRIALTRRSQMHRRISKRGEEIYGDRVAEIASELAVHFDQGRDWQRAVKYHLLAAENAARRSANFEAVALARRGLELVKLLPASAERAQQEIRLRLILGASLMTIKGSAAKEVEDVYLPARELCEQQGESLQLFKVLWSLRLYYMFRGEMQTSREIAERLARQAESLADAALMVEAHRALGSSLINLGDFAAALEHFERAYALYKESDQDAYFLIHGNDAKVMSLCFAARVLWCLGYPEQSLHKIREAMTQAQEISHTQSLVVALQLATHIHQLRREPLKTRQLAETGIALAKEHGLELWMTLCALYRGWAQVEQGEVESGIEEMRAGVDVYQSIGAKLWRAHHLGLLAEASAKAGRVGEGLSILAEALATVEETGERYYEAELHRIRGELLVMQASGAGDHSEATRHGSPLTAQAESCFKQAISVARRQQAKSWELRAAISLARLYRRQGMRAEARAALADIFAWFTEGFDTADLMEARALLDELS
jgi:DNA-binding winged helix-turn-helix (wHTH) protein/predicted ATPase